MNTIPKSKGKKATKTAKNKPEVEMENSQNNSDQMIHSKKRKFNEIEEACVTVPVQKKSKRKRNNEEKRVDSNDQNQIVSEDLSKANLKKVQKKSEIIKNDEINLNMDTEMSPAQPINVKATTKRKKAKNTKVLSINANNVEVKDECVPLPNEIVPPKIINEVITDNVCSVPKKHKKKMQQSEMKSVVPQNGNICTNTDILNDPYNVEKSEVSMIPSDATNCYNNVLKNEIDIDENNLLEMKTSVNKIAYNSLNNNEVEMKREVNVIDIKNEGGENPEKVVTISIRDIDGVNTNKDEDELLKQLERKLKPKVPKETINWPEEDLKELLRRMELCLPSNDIKLFSKRLEILEWDNIIFKDYTIEQCRNMWFKLQKKVRKYRILSEVLQDTKSWVEMYAKTKSETKTKTLISKKKGRPQKHPDMPRKPLTAYFIFYLKNRDSYLSLHPGIDAAEVSKGLAQIFQTLSVEEKKKYEELALQKREEYNKKVDEFYEKHPEVPRSTKESKAKVDKTVKPVKEKPPPKPVKEKLPPKPVKEKPSPKPLKEKLPKLKGPLRPHPPFHYFYISELEKDNVEDKIKFKEICKERWKQLPERNKLVWIHYAEAEIAKYEEDLEDYVKLHPDFVKNPVKPVLSKEDKQIKDRAAGKPVKPPGSAYNLFASKLLQSDEIKKVPVRDRLVFVSNQWKYCSDDEKKYYKDMYNDLISKYKEEYTAYLGTLPEDERKELLKTNVPKIFKNQIKVSKVKKKKLTAAKTEKKSVPKTKTKPPENEAPIKQPEKLNEPQQPPISPFKYFCSLYTGEEPVSQAWKALTKQQKKQYEEELIQKKKDYIRDFEKFLKSLSEEELEAFSKSRRRAKEEKVENEEEEESDSYDSEESSEDEEEEEQEDS